MFGELISIIGSLVSWNTNGSMSRVSFVWFGLASPCLEGVLSNGFVSVCKYNENQEDNHEYVSNLPKLFVEKDTRAYLIFKSFIWSNSLSFL